MAAGDIALNIIINASQGNASGIIGQISGSLMGLAAGSGPLGAIVGIGATATAALVGVGASAVKAAGDFQSGMTSLVTGAGEAQSNIKMVSDGILAMSTATGTSTKDLTAAMYEIESSGQHGAAGLAVLKAAAEGAKVGNADLDTVAKALTTTLTDYHLPASDATSVTNGLIAAVAAGKTHMQDMAAAMGNVLPLASSLGISFPQVSGAIATMTNAGMSAQRASMNLANAIRSLAAPGATAQKAMKDVGISTSQLNDVLTHQGLAAALQMIEDHVGKKFPAGSSQWTAAMKAIMGGATGLNVALMLGGKNMQGYEANIKSISSAMGQGGDAVKGWDLVQEDFNFQMDRAKAALQVFLITLGEKLLPIITPIVAGITNFVGVITRLIGGMNTAGGSSKTLQNILGLLGVTFSYLGGIFQAVGQVLGSLFAAAAKAAAGALGDFAKNVLPGLIAGLNGILFNIRNVTTAFASWFTSTNQAGKIVGGLSEVLKELGSFLATTFKPVWDQLVTTFNTEVKPAWNDFMKTLGPAMPGLKLIAEVVGVVLVVAFKLFAMVIANSLKNSIVVLGTLIAGVLYFAASIMRAIGSAVLAWNMLKAAWNAAPGFFAGIWDAIKKAFQSAWDWIAGGAKSAWTWVVNAWGAAGQWFQNIGKGIQTGINDAWTWIQNTAKTAWDDIVKLVTGAVEAVAGSFQWLYNHNYYIKDLVDFIRNTFQDGLQWLENAWNGTVVWLTQLWDQVSRTAQTTWQKVTGFIQTEITAAAKFIEDQWSNISTWLAKQWDNLATWAKQAWQAVTKVFQGVWSTISQALTSLWNNISNWWSASQKKSTDAANGMWKNVQTVFNNAWTTYIATPLNKLVTSISSWFTTQANNFKTWAGNMMTMFAQGITNGVANVIAALTNLGTNIAKLLGFHSPPQSGPLATSGTWMPNMMKMFASGIASNTPLVTNATNRLANTINLQFTTMNTNVKTNVTGINSQLNLLNTNMTNATTTINTKLLNLNTTVNTTTANINQQVASVNNIASPAFLNVGKSATQAGQVVTQAGSQISSSTQQTAQSVEKSSSSMKVSFGQTTQYATQTVYGVKASTEAINQAVTDSKKHSDEAIKEMVQYIHDAVTGNIIGALVDFVQFVYKTAQTALDEARYVAGQIAALLGHSTPSMGPLKDDNLWGKHFMENIIGGMQEGMPLLTGMTNTIATTLAGVGLGPNAALSIGGQPISINGQTATPSSQPMVIYVQLDKKTIGKAAMQYQQKEVHVQGGIRGI